MVCSAVSNKNKLKVQTKLSKTKATKQQLHNYKPSSMQRNHNCFENYIASYNSKTVQHRAILIMIYRTAPFSMTLKDFYPGFNVTLFFDAEYIRIQT